MRHITTYEIVITASHRQVRLTLMASVWDKQEGLKRRSLKTVWAPWENCMESARKLVQEGLQLSSDGLPPMLPLGNDTPKASAPPGGPRGGLSVTDAMLKNARPHT